jgi:RNA polymerase sigma-70 factor, ECF subfamily
VIRINLIHQHGSAHLHVEGQLTAATADQLSAACSAAFDQGLDLTLRLDGVTYSDRAGAKVVFDAIARGATVTGCNGLLDEMLAIASRPPADRSTDRELVERLRAKDESAYEEVIDRFGGRMLSVARRFLSSEDDARDAVQEAFASAVESISGFAGDALLSTWLHRIVVNAALMQLRRRRRKPEVSIDALLPEFDKNGRWVAHNGPLSISLDEVMERRESRELVRHAIAQLPESYRTILMLRDIEDLDSEEVAGTLGITYNAVKVRLHRARQALRTLIERETRKNTQTGNRVPESGCL